MTARTQREFAKAIRLDILDMVHRAGSEGAHLGGCLSLVEILTVLYHDLLRYDPQRPNWEYRDRVILSKAHGSIALYAAMHQAGILSDEQIQQPLYGKETFLYKHSVRNTVYGLEMSGGSLGQGLPFAVGVAIALRRKRNCNSRVYAILGDGECNEGSIWEAAALAGHLALNNLTVVVDKNQLQLDGATRDILNMDNMAQRWSAFGFDVVEVPGHDCERLLRAFQKTHNGPLAVIANTVKGNGISFAAGNYAWHNNHLTDELYKKALEETV